MSQEHIKFDSDPRSRKERMMNSEKGQVLPLALLALLVGTLAVTPFLAHAGSSLIGSGIYGQAMRERYSAEAGVEYALWHLQGGGSAVPQFTINDKTVNVTVQNQAERMYRITSIAAGIDGRGSTTIEAYVLMPPDFFAGNVNIMNNEVFTGDAFADGSITLLNNAEIHGGAYATGNITLNNNALITGDVVAGGDINLENNAEIGGLVSGNISAGGSLTLSNNVKITGNVYVAGNITLANNTEIVGDIRVGGDLALENNSIIKGNVFIDGNITISNNAKIRGNIYATGDITITFGSDSIITGHVFARGNVTISGPENITGNIWENYTGAFPDPPACPGMPLMHTSILSWEITGQ